MLRKSLCVPGREKRASRTRRLQIEPLEARELLAISLQGVPTWSEQGPGPIFGGATEGLSHNPVTGAVEAIAFRPGSTSEVFIGATNGGIWRTTNINASPSPGPR